MIRHISLLMLKLKRLGVVVPAGSDTPLHGVVPCRTQEKRSHFADIAIESWFFRGFRVGNCFISGWLSQYFSDCDRAVEGGGGFESFESWSQRSLPEKSTALWEIKNNPESITFRLPG